MMEDHEGILQSRTPHIQNLVTQHPTKNQHQKTKVDDAKEQLKSSLSEQRQKNKAT